MNASSALTTEFTLDPNTLAYALETEDGEDVLCESRIFLKGTMYLLPFAFDPARLPGIKKIFKKSWDKKRTEKILILMSTLALIHQAKGGEINYSREQFTSETILFGDYFKPFYSPYFEKHLCARRPGRPEMFTYRVRYLNEEELDSLLSHSIHKKTSLPFIRKMLGLFPNEPLNFTTLDEKLWETEPTVFYDCKESDI